VWLSWCEQRNLNRLMQQVTMRRANKHAHFLRRDLHDDLSFSKDLDPMNQDGMKS